MNKEDVVLKRYHQENRHFFYKSNVSPFPEILLQHSTFLCHYNEKKLFEYLSGSDKTSHELLPNYYEKLITSPIGIEAVNLTNYSYRHLGRA